MADGGALGECPPGHTWVAAQARCVRTSYGVNQGDQAEQSAREFEDAAKRSAAKWSLDGRRKAAELRLQAEQLRRR